MEYQTILLEKNDGVAKITFNRPEKKNAMSPQFHVEMRNVLQELKYDEETRVVVLTGAGDSFCAGQDLKQYFYDIDHDPIARGKAREASAEWRAYNLRLFPKPTIAAINGWCFGGAFTIVASCDFAIASKKAKFGLSEVNFGKLAGGHVTKVVSEYFHPRDAIYYLLTGKPFDAEKAAEVKFITQAVEHEDLWPTVNELANILKQKNPIVLQMQKEAYKHIAGMSYEQAGAYLTAKNSELEKKANDTWKTGVEQFKAGSYRPGLGTYQWKE